jgi:hypothetical protein
MLRGSRDLLRKPSLLDEMRCECIFKGPEDFQITGFRCKAELLRFTRFNRRHPSVGP